jgi:hypothetical protein
MATRESSKYTPQMTVWHNTLAIWLWRYLIATIEGLSIPGMISALQLIVYHVPTYFLWGTGFLTLMLLTPQTASKEKVSAISISFVLHLLTHQKANTWYARWLSGATKAAKSAAAAVDARSSSRSRADDPGRSSRPTT